MAEECENYTDSEDEGNLKIVIESPDIEKVKTRNPLETLIREKSIERQIFKSPDNETSQDKTESLSEKEENLSNKIESLLEQNGDLSDKVEDSSDKKEDTSCIEEDLSSTKEVSPDNEEDFPDKEKKLPDIEEDSPENEEDLLDNEEDSLDNEEDSPNNEEDSSDNKEDSSDKLEDSPSKEDDSTDYETDSSDKEESSPNKEEDTPYKKENSSAKKECSSSKNESTPNKKECSPSGDVDFEDEDDIQRILKAFNDERVVSLVKQIMNPDTLDSTKEEKLTRAKRRLLLSEDAPPLSWIKTTPPPAEIQQLITDELQEDSSGDEYIPANDEIPSDDDEPATPKSIDNATQTSWTEDGLFKVPSTIDEKEENLNIALRTRSKLSLSSTPLEDIAETLIPPDLTTDMYDLDCDVDDDWKDFLKTFTRPIDEFDKGGEDEDHDPEYNVQEEVVDIEDLICEDVDLEVSHEDIDLEVSHEELNALLVELLADDFNDPLKNNKQSENEEVDAAIEEMPIETLPLPSNVNDLPAKSPSATVVLEVVEEEVIDNEIYVMLEDHKKILRYQMAQHVQLLTQNYIQTYKHREYHDMAQVFHDFLSNLNNLGTLRVDSFFHTPNLREGLKVIEEWTRRIDNNDEDVQQMRNLQENYTITSLFTFPELMLNTLSRSKAFIFPDLLPIKPFLPKNELQKGYWYTDLEDQLIAFELEQFSPLIVNDIKNKSNDLRVLCKYISMYVMPHRTLKGIYQRVLFCNEHKSLSHPIKYYLENRKLLQNIVLKQADKLELIAPCERQCEELPRPWREHVYPEWNYGDNLVNSSYYAKTFKDLKNLRRRRKHRLNRENPKRKLDSKSKNQIEIVINPSSYSNKLETCFTTDTIILDIENSVRNFKFNTKILQEMDLPTISTEEKNELQITSTLSDGRKEDPELTNITKDNLEDINALMIASSTINNQKRRLSAAESKRKRIRREFTSNLSLLIPEDPLEEKENLNNFVHAFYEKIQDRLEVADNNKFMQLLCDFEGGHSPLELVRNIDAVLTKYPDLAEEFLAFLTPTQAHTLGKFVPYFMLTNMSLFLRKLEIYFKDQPSQVKKIYKSLEQLSECVNLTMERIKLTILPLLKSNKLLMEWFLQLFPVEKPPTFLLNGPSETLPLSKGTDTNPAKGISSEDLFEIVTIPDVEDPYGGTNCICDCHSIHLDEAFKTRQKHCIPCGTKFLQGRVYVQTGKGLRLAKIVFDTPDAKEHYARLGCTYNNNPITNKKRADSSPTKNLSTSPNKEPHLEEGRSLSSDDDGIDCKKKLKRNFMKSPRKRKLVPTATLPETSNNCTNKPTSTTQEIDKQNSSKSPGNLDESKSCISTEKMDWDCKTSVESMDIRLSPEQVSAADDSGSEFCEESSQDNMSDCEGDEMGCDNDNILSPVHSDNSNSNPVPDDVSWTREEDRIILKTFQSEGNTEATFKRVSEILENRTIEQIKTRFERLIRLLQEMAAASGK